MPLSEEELRLLEQMERALVEEDPKFASTLRGSSFRSNMRRKAIWAGAAFAVGVAVLMTGAIMSLTPVGIAGFVIMLASATFGLTVIRGRAPAAPTDDDHEAPAEPRQRGGLGLIDGGRSGRKPRRTRNHAPFMERMEERWRRRREGGF